MFSTPTVVGEFLYVASCAGGIYAFETRTGVVRWQYRTSRDGPPANFHGDPAIAGDLLLIGGDKEPSARLYALDLLSGEPRWSVQFDGGVWGDVVRRGRTLVALTRRGDVVAVDLEAGRRVWTFDRGPRQEARPPGSALLAGDRIVFAARPRDLIALDADTGAVAWHVTFDATPTTSAVTAAGALVIGTSAGKLHRVDPATGTFLASLAVGGRPAGTPVMSVGCIFALVGDALACVDLTLARVRWRAVNPGGWSSLRPLVRGAEVIVGDAVGKLVAFSLAGDELWRMRLVGEIRGLGTHQDLLFVGTRAGRIYAVRVGQP